MEPKNLLSGRKGGCRRVPPWHRVHWLRRQPGIPGPVRDLWGSGGFVQTSHSFPLTLTALFPFYNRNHTNPPLKLLSISLLSPYHKLGSGFLVVYPSNEFRIRISIFFGHFPPDFPGACPWHPPSPLRELQEEARGQERKRRQASEVGEVDRQLDRWQEEYARGGRRTGGGGGTDRQPEVNIAVPLPPLW